MKMTAKDKKILVLGATGHQGGAVVRHLLKNGFTNIHAFVRADEGDKAKPLGDKGVVLQKGDLDNIGSIDAAMQGAYGVFSVMPFDPQGPDVEIGRGKAVADAARRAKVQHFVYSSVNGADRSQGVPDFHSKYVIEQYVHELGLSASVVRPAGFMENFMTFEHPRLVDGVAVFRVAVSPDKKRQMIAVDDIGMVAADMFARPEKFLGRTLEIAGDEVTGTQIAEIYTKVTGQPARYEEQPIEEVRDFNPAFAAMFTWVNEQGFKADIAKLREEYPELTTFEAWLNQHKPAVMAQ